MPTGEFLAARDLLDLLQFVRDELLVFALFWFVIGAIDELAIDGTWLWLRLTGRSTTPRLSPGTMTAPLEGRMAVLFPAWSEAEVIGDTIAHTLRAWPQAELRLYLGCYPNDTATLQAAMAAAGRDDRIRLVILDRGIM